MLGASTQDAWRHTNSGLIPAAICEKLRRYVSLLHPWSLTGWLASPLSASSWISSGHEVSPSTSWSLHLYLGTTGTSGTVTWKGLGPTGIDTCPGGYQAPDISPMPPISHLGQCVCPLLFSQVTASISLRCILFHLLHYLTCISYGFRHLGGSYRSDAVRLWTDLLAPALTGLLFQILTALRRLMVHPVQHRLCTKLHDFGCLR